MDVKVHDATAPFFLREAEMSATYLDYGRNGG